MSASPASLISAETSPHYVPTKDIQAQLRQPKSQDPEWGDFLRKLAETIEQENAAEEMLRIRKVVRNRHYYRGRQSGYFSLVTGQYTDVEDADILYTKNYVRALTKKRTAVWSRSRTEFSVRARSDKQEARDGARMADKVADFYQEVLFPESVRQREGKFVALSGESYRYYYWAADGGRLIDMPIFEDRAMKIGQDSYVCWNCESSGPASSDMWGCPTCGSENIALQPAPETTVKIPVGVKKVREGEVVMEVVDPLEIKTDLHARSIDESPYLRRDRLVRMEIMRAKFPRFEFSGMSAGNEMHNFQAQLELSPGNLSSGTTGTSYALARGSSLRGVRFRQHWIDPVMYAEYMFPYDTPIGAEGREVIPGGTKAIELFPDGLYFAMGGEAIIDERPETKRDHWAHLRDDLIPEAMHGDGSIDDIIELQDLLNDVHSLRFEYLMRCTVPPLFYDKRVTQGSTIVNRPGEKVPLQNLNPGEPIGNSFYQLQSQGLDNHVDAFIEITQRDMVEFSGAYSDQAAAPELKQGTATAAQLAHDQSMGLAAVPLALKAEADIRTFEAILKLVQKHWNAPRYLPLLGSHSFIEGQWFDAAQIPEDFILVMSDKSYMPRNSTEERNDFIASMQASPALPLGPYTPGLSPFLSQRICTVFNQPFDEDGQAAAERLAAYKMRKIIDLAEQFEESAMGEAEDPTAQATGIQMILMQFPVNPRIDLPEPTTRVITEWLLSDDGIQSSPFVQQILNQRIEMVEMAGVMQMRQDQMKMIAANPAGMMQGEQGGQSGNEGGQKPPQQGAQA